MGAGLANDRGQKTEDRDQMSDVGCQTAEGRRQRAEGR